MIFVHMRLHDHLFTLVVLSSQGRLCIVLANKTMVCDKTMSFIYVALKKVFLETTILISVYFSHFHHGDGEFGSNTEDSRTRDLESVHLIRDL